MRKIAGATYVICVTVAAFALVIIARALLSAVDGAELTDPPRRSSYNGEVIPGFVVFNTCSIGGDIPSFVSPWVLVRPAAIWGIGNPPDSPNGCVKIRVGSVAVYVKGNEFTVAGKIAAAEDN